ncbi:hypothetical protein [Pelodictyon luteolum]|nr:hypothetical protein [Pelodictyon luteolum]
MKEQDARGKILLYSSPDGSLTLDVCLEKESIWLMQKQMSVLFEKNVRTISEHVGSVFQAEGRRGPFVSMLSGVIPLTRPVSKSSTEH